MTKTSFFRSLGFTGLIAGLWMGADLWSKAWAISANERSIRIVGDFLTLQPFHTNPGIAFGIRLPMAIQIVGSMLILGLLFWVSLKQEKEKGKQNFLKSGLLGIIIGGGLGNLWERIAYGEVVDFIALGPIPLFNLADTGLTLGLLSLALLEIYESKKREEKAPADLKKQT